VSNNKVLKVYFMIYLISLVLIILFSTYSGVTNYYKILVCFLLLTIGIFLRIFPLTAKNQILIVLSSILFMLSLILPILPMLSAVLSTH